MRDRLVVVKRINFREAELAQDVLRVLHVVGEEFGFVGVVARREDPAAKRVVKLQELPDIRPAQCFAAFFARADADDVVNAGDEDFAVADVSRIKFELEQLDEVCNSLLLADDEEAGLRQELDVRGFFRRVFIRAVLDAAAERLKDRDARDAGRAEFFEERRELLHAHHDLDACKA